MIVADSSPIIVLAKHGRLALLKGCFNEVIIPKSVHEEIMQKKDGPEVIDLNRAIKGKWVIVEEASVIPMLVTKNIGPGEKDAISLASKHKSLLLVDDDSAKKYASIFGVEAHGSFFVIYLACMKNLIKKEDAISILERMMTDGFYISSELYAKFFELLNSRKK